ncbi:Hcp family type VI secretion system effector [Pseudoduganella chitinolytica]|uniref:Type VI secretion system tube protein Hcp n=1 Tax=Pseudoduganella chitinolytica TaxID=34070 RepID=A0ABY8BGW5_9BURK|nr:type VI secretion system tube protein Hcp [Pseudoduganella chitinolytica]WEF34213.1 type VI secretion system tube protein Hcp [Pseudoduganella chitinolytica]
MAVDMFINMGADIKGETTDEAQKKKNDIDVLAWSWGMSQSGTTHMGGGGGSGKASFQDLSFTKYVDSASNALMFALARGKHVEKAELLVRKAGAGQVDYIKITMEEVLVTSISTGGSGGEDRLTENVTLNFAKVNFVYKPQDEKGILGGDMAFTWDIAASTGKVQ